MAGVGKLLKQAQKMQKQMETMQAGLSSREFEVSNGGGAVTVRVNGQGEVLSLKLDPEFLKEEAALVEDTIVSAVREAAAKAKAAHEEEMSKLTAGFSLPGLM